MIYNVYKKHEDGFGTVYCYKSGNPEFEIFSWGKDKEKRLKEGIWLIEKFNIQNGDEYDRIFNTGLTGKYKINYNEAWNVEIKIINN